MKKKKDIKLMPNVLISLGTEENMVNRPFCILENRKKKSWTLGLGQIKRNLERRLYI